MDEKLHWIRYRMKVTFDSHFDVRTNAIVFLCADGLKFSAPNHTPPKLTIEVENCSFILSPLAEADSLTPAAMRMLVERFWTVNGMERIFTLIEANSTNTCTSCRLVNFMHDGSKG